jgi:tRNA(fMet)-specific endonuclease VapC
MKYLLDTNVLAEPLTKKPSKLVLAKLARHEARCATAMPIVHELIYGAELLEPSRRKDAVELYIQNVILRVYPVLDYDLAAAKWQAEERARLARLGRPPAFADSTIAAIASVNNLVLVTRNLKDFVRFRNLEVESWDA